MELPATEKVNLESLITEEELEQLKDIRVSSIPKKIRQIGAGTYGKVYLFKFEDGNFRVGKKPKINLYNKSLKEESKMKKHFSYAFHEMKVLHQLDHERIIEFFGFYLDQSQLIIFMEAMNGSVKDEINKKGCLSEIEAMKYFIQATEGLVYLHSRKPKAIIHRDIKCENLLLTAEKNLKLADFGLAVDLAISSGSVTLSSKAPTMLVGTHHFIAPEVIGKMEQPEAYGRKSDIWSLACTLVQMISSRPPYGNLSSHEVAQRSSSNSQNPLIYSGHQLLPAASNEIKKILDSLFIVDCKLRPSAKEVLALAHDNLGNMYSAARNVLQSVEEAVKEFKNSTVQGNAYALIRFNKAYISKKVWMLCVFIVSLTVWWWINSVIVFPKNGDWFIVFSVIISVFVCSSLNFLLPASFFYRFLNRGLNSWSFAVSFDACAIIMRFFAIFLGKYLGLHNIKFIRSFTRFSLLFSCVFFSWVALEYHPDMPIEVRRPMTVVYMFIFVFSDDIPTMYQWYEGGIIAYPKSLFKNFYEGFVHIKAHFMKTLFGQPNK